MSGDTTIVRPAETKPRQQEKDQRRPKLLPPYAVVVLNDEDHTFQYVIDTFIKVFGYRTEKAFQLTVQIHEQGRSVVWSGPKEVAELKRDQIRGAGPDFYAERKIEYPLGVLIEPLPG